MASAFAQLPVRVLWRLSKSEVLDEDAIADLNLGNNTKARLLTAFPYLILSSPCLQLLLPTIYSLCFFLLVLLLIRYKASKYALKELPGGRKSFNIL